MNILKSGIDISGWQGNFDMAQAKEEGFDFVIVKGGGGDAGLYTDSRFAENYTKAKSLGMPVGVYWFSKALTVDAAVKEAEYFYENCLKGKQFELPIYIDVENKTQLAVGKRLLTDIIKAWCQNLEDKGFWVGIYSSQSYFSSYMYDDELQAYAHWVACWAKTCNYTKDCFGMWQYGGETNLIRSNQVAGVTCDQDYLLIDYPTLIKAAKKNGYGVSPAVPAQPVTPPTPVSPAKTNLVAGAKLTLNAVALYASSTSATKAGTKTGTYYLWSDAVVNNRVRITNSTANVGNASQVTGWISVSDAEAASGSGTSTSNSSTSTSAPATDELTAGTKLALKSVALYATSTSTTKAGTKTGTYYVWGTQVVNNRIRITNSTANVGKSTQVTGWIDLSDAKAAVSS